MNDSAYNSAKSYKESIARISAIQTANALSGAKVSIVVSDSKGQVLVHENEIVAAIGQNAYNTLIATDLTALNTALANAKSTANTAYAAL